MPLTSGNSDHPLSEVCGTWIEKIRLATDFKREKFQADADEAMLFFNGPYDWLYAMKNSTNSKGFVYTGEDGEVARPTFSMTVNKAAEMVQIFGPALYHKNPIRQVNPRQFPILPIELLGDPQDPMVQQFFIQMAQQTKSLRGVDKGRAVLLHSLLNYTPNALDLKTESRNSIDEGIIKGLGLLWPEVYQPSGSSTKLIRSRFGSSDDLIMDPDMESFREARWACERCCKPYWEVEDEYQLERDSLRSATSMESYNRQAEIITDSGGLYNRRRGLTNDLVVYYKLYSKMGVGALLAGVNPSLREQLGQYGRFCYLVLVENIPYPLNISPQVSAAMASEDEAMRMAASQLVQKALEWPTPYWADDTWPFSPLVFHNIPKQMWPMSHLKPGIGELKFINWAYSFLAGKVATSCRDFIAIAKSAGEELKENIRVGRDYTYLEVENIHGSIDSVVKFLQHPSFQPDIYKVVEAVERNFEKRVGLTELAYGLSENQMRSAQEAQVKENQVNVRPEDMANKTEDWMGDVARKEAFASRWHLTGQDVAPVLGPVGAQYWEELLVPSDPNEILHQLEYRIEAGSARKPNKARDTANMQQAMQTLLPHLLGFATATGDFTGVNALITDWARTIDLDPEKYLFKPPAMLQPPTPPGSAPGAAGVGGGGSTPGSPGPPAGPPSRPGMPVGPAPTPQTVAPTNGAPR